MMRSISIVILTAFFLSACGSANSPAPPVDQPPDDPPVDEPTEPPAAPIGQWYSGDLHVHDDHSSDGSATRQCCDDRGPGNVSISDQIGFAQLMGLEFLPLTDHRTYDQHYDPLWESDAVLLLRGEEANGSPHATVQGAVDTVVQGANPPETPDFVNVQQSIWDAHAQGANWITAHPDDGELEDDGVTPNARANAVGADLVEAWNKASNVDKEIVYAEDRWNRGFRFGVAGASDNHFRELWVIAGPGMPTTRVFASALTERAVVDALRAGRTVLSADALTAPTVTLEADFQNDDVYEAIAGDEVIAPAATAGHLRVRVTNGFGNNVIVYKSPGQSAGNYASYSALSPELQSEWTLDVTAESVPTWYRAEVRGLGLPAGIDTGDVPLSLIPSLTELPNQLRAMTSPIFVSTAPVEATPEIATPADIGTADGARLVMGEQDRFAGFPDIAVVDSMRHVVAETHVDGASRIRYTRLDGSQQHSVELTPEAQSARFPHIAALGEDVWVVWQDEPAGEVPHRSVIMLRHSSDRGMNWQSPVVVRSIEGRVEHPVLALLPTGAPVVAWQEIARNRAFDVFVQIIGRDAEPTNLSGDGKSVAAANLLDTRSSRYPASVWPSIAVAPDGRVALAWQDNRTDAEPLWTGATLTGEGTDPDNWQIQSRSLAFDATEWGVVTTLGADDRADRHPSIAFSADGQLLAIWDSKPLNSSGANVSLLAAASIDGGASWREPEAVGYDAHAMSLWPRLGRGANGHVRAVWYDTRSSDWRQRVMTAVRDDGQWSSSGMLMSPGINTWPATAGDVIAFASTRNAVRLQRDRTQQIFVVTAP